MAAARSPPESVPERGTYRVVFAPSVAVRDAPWGQKVGTKAQGDVVRTDMRSVGDDRLGWVRLEGGYEGGEGWMLVHGAALGLGTLLEARRPYVSHISSPHYPNITPTSPHVSPHLPYISRKLLGGARPIPGPSPNPNPNQAVATPAEPAGSSSARPASAEYPPSSAGPALLFLCTGEGEHSADSDVGYLRASPSWLDVQARCRRDVGEMWARCGRDVGEM